MDHDGVGTAFDKGRKTGAGLGQVLAGQVLGCGVDHISQGPTVGALVTGDEQGLDVQPAMVAAAGDQVLLD